VRRALRLAIAAFFIAGVIAYAWVRVQKLKGTFGNSATPMLNAQLSGDPGAVRWLKGQLHVHSANSGDSKTAPEQVAKWYAQHGYDFIVFTDHNHITSLPPVDGMLALPGVEITQNLDTCEPPPPQGMQCLLHVNALFVDPSREVELKPLKSAAREDVYGRAIDAAKEMGGIAQVNHPNFHYGADAALLVKLAARGARLVEIANEAVDSNNEGDASHPSTEALWDAALDAGARLYGTATDDAHHYYDADEVRAKGETAFTGDRGFVMVHARKTPQDIREAIERGEFYASTGLVLSGAGHDGGYTVERGMLGRTTITGPEGRAWTQPRFSP